MNQSREDRLGSEVASRVVGCPDADALNRFDENRLDAADRRRIEEHIKTCSPCRKAVSFLERSRDIEEFPEPLPPDVERRSDELLQDLGSIPAPRPSPWPVLFQAAAVLALVAALAVGGFSLLGPGRAPGDLGSLRGDEPLTLLSPAGDTVAPPAEMRWVAYPGAVRYRIDLLDERLQEIWSRKSTGPEPVLTLGQSDQDLLIPGHRYTWRVIALDEFDAKVGQSPAAHFEISLP